MSNLVIAGVELTTDSEGRFNLNALHKMSGLGTEKRPGEWLKNGPAQELVEELSKVRTVASPKIAAVNSIRGGNTQGTFAVKQIAVAYANWISPAFY